MARALGARAHGGRPGRADQRPAAAWPLSRYLESILFGIAPTHAATYAGVAVVLAAAAALASAIPAGGAARLDPVRALREERD